MFKVKDKVIVLPDWPLPDGGSPEPCVWANESKLILSYFTNEETIAVILFPLVSIFKFGSPNDESLGGHPLISNGLKFYNVHRIEGSSWLSELEKQNSVHPRHDKAMFVKDKCHYIFTFHDSTLEIIASEGEFWPHKIAIVKTKTEAKKIINEAKNI